MSRAERLARGLGLGLLAASGVLAGPLAAQDGNVASLRPTGPVTIEADRAEWQKGGAMVYSGNVRLDSGELKLQGTRLHLRQFEDGQFEARVEGSPALLDHAGLPPEAGEPRRPVSARAQELTYDTRIEIVQITGDALLTRGSDEIRGQSIRYDVANRRIQADGGQGGQVRIVIQPPPRQDNDDTPAPDDAPDAPVSSP